MLLAAFLSLAALVVGALMAERSAENPKFPPALSVAKGWWEFVSERQRRLDAVLLLTASSYKQAEDEIKKCSPIFHAFFAAT